MKQKNNQAIKPGYFTSLFQPASTAGHHHTCKISDTASKAN